MRAILWIVLALGVLWGGYWFVGSTAVERSVRQWFDAQSAQGMTATQEGIAVAGFPNRFDLTVTKPHLADPLTGWGWQAPFAQVFSMTWKPWHLIAALPQDQEIDAPDQKVSLHSSRLIASVRFAPSTDLALEEAVIEGHDVLAKSDHGWQLAASSLVFALERDATRANAQRLGLDVANLTPDLKLAQSVPELGPTISVIHLDATLLLTAPLDRHVAETPLALNTLLVTDFHLNWGDLKISASGQVDRAPDGFASGKIDFRIENWRTIPALIVALGLVEPGMGDTLTRGIAELAKSGSDPNVLNLPLNFAEGRMNLGPIPLGPAPMLN